MNLIAAARRYLLAVTVLAGGSIHAQRAAQNDSLLQVFAHDGDHNARVSAGFELMNGSLTSDPQRSVRTGDRILHMLDSLVRAQVITDTTANDARMSVLQSMSIAYNNLGDFDAQMNCAMRKLELAQRAGDREKEGSALEVIGGIYQGQGHKAEALGYYRRALAIFQETGSTYHLALELGNVGGVIGELQPDSVLWYYKRSLEVMQRPDMTDRGGAMGWMMNNIGDLFEERGQVDSAFHYYYRSLAIRESVDHRLGQYLVHRDIAELLADQGRLAQALDHVNASIRIAVANNFRYNLDKSYLLRSEILGRLGRYQEALKDHRRYVAQRDSIISDRNTKQLVQQTMRYEYGRKLLADSLAFEKERAVQELDNRLAQEKIKRTRNIYLFSGIGVLLLAGGLWSRLRYTHRAKVAIEKEKKVSEDLLHNILPEEVAAELKEKGEAEAKLIDQVTVLFTDFKGFTAMSEQLSPKDLVKDIHECFSAFDRIIEKHGIEKIKTIGDAYMAAGGLPVPNDTHAVDVINAALEMRDFIAEGKRHKLAKELPYFEIRIGVHTGPVVAGIVGVKKFQYDIWGDTVNTASRMESSGEPGQVNISEATYAHVREQAGSLFHFTPRGRVHAKGKGEMEMYFVRRSAENA